MQSSLNNKHSRLLDKGPLYSFLLLFLIVVFGSLGFMTIENYRFIDAVYMTIITMTTVGFGEIQPLSDPGKWFAIFLILTSIGIFAYAIGSFSKYLLDGIFTNRFKISRVKKKIESLEGHVIVVGYGRNGSEAALELKELNETALVIDQRPDIILKIQEEGFLFIEGDATNDATLTMANIKNAKALISALPNDADNLYVVLSAKELNPNLKIISRALNSYSDKKLKFAGATNVIMPDRLGGKHMANLVAQRDIIEFVDNILLRRTNNVRLEEISCKQLNNCFKDQSIGQVDVRNKSGANIIGMRLEDGSYIFNPAPSVKLTPNDQLFVLGSPEQLTKLKRILENG